MNEQLTHLLQAVVFTVSVVYTLSVVHAIRIQNELGSVAGEAILTPKTQQNY